MIWSLIRKVLYAIIVLWGVVTVVFFLFRILPGDPARMMAGQRSDEQTLKAIRSEMGLDHPVIVQYVRYLNDLSVVGYLNSSDPKDPFYADRDRLSNTTVLFNTDEGQWVLKWPYLGRSFQSRQPISGIIGDVLPNTIVLAFASIFLAFIFGVWFGIIAATHKDTVWDRFLLVISSMGMSLPSFFAAILMGWIFAYLLGDITGLNLTGNLYEIDDLGEGRHLMLRNLILPAVTLGIRPLSVVLQLTRNSLLEVLSQDYIRTARAKGLAYATIIRRHALKNALNPVITATSGWFASLMAGVIFVEYIFGWKGLGFVVVNALNNYDIPLVLGCVLTIAFIFFLINLAVEVIYRLLDPRIR